MYIYIHIHIHMYIHICIYYICMLGCSHTQLAKKNQLTFFSAQGFFVTDVLPIQGSDKTHSEKVDPLNFFGGIL